jgi:hypothetical protein
MSAPYRKPLGLGRARAIVANFATVARARLTQALSLMRSNVYYRDHINILFPVRNPVRKRPLLRYYAVCPELQRAFASTTQISS